MDLYIYYRVECSHAQELQNRVQHMQTNLIKQYSLIAELKRRPEENDGCHTWMEVYRNIPENFDRMLETAVMNAGVRLLIDGERHIEHFLDFSACA
jgi:hypothetical protein